MALAVVVVADPVVLPKLVAEVDTCSVSAADVVVDAVEVDMGSPACASIAHPPISPTKLPAAMNIRILVRNGFFCFMIVIPPESKLRLQ